MDEEHHKNRGLEIIPTITGAISFVSSIYLLYRILQARPRRSNHRRNKTRDQLLLGLSCLDVCGSLGLSFSTFVAPIGTDWSHGTIGTCTFQGFLVQLGLGVPLYNAALCIYFVLAVRYNITDTRLSRWMVPAVHGTVLPFIVFSAVYGAATTVFNYAGTLGCWAHRVSLEGCKSMPELCGRGKNASEFTWNFGGCHLIVCFVVVVVSMLILYCTVRTIENRSARWNPSFRLSKTTTTANTSMTRGGDDQNNNNLEDPASCFSLGAPERPSLVRSSQPPRRRAVSMFARAPPTSTPLTNTTRETGFYYAVSFLLVYMPTYMLVLVNFKHDGVPHTIVRYLNVTFLPLQGFFNLLIYTAAEWRPWVRKQLVCCVDCSWRNEVGEDDGEEEETPDMIALEEVSETSRMSSRIQDPAAEDCI